jgi:hypothetical protein
MPSRPDQNRRARSGSSAGNSISPNGPCTWQTITARACAVATGASALSRAYSRLRTSGTSPKRGQLDAPVAAEAIVSTAERLHLDAATRDVEGVLLNTKAVTAAGLSLRVGLGCTTETAPWATMRHSVASAPCGCYGTAGAADSVSGHRSEGLVEDAALVAGRWLRETT